MSGEGTILSPRWPRRKTAYEREIDALRLELTTPDPRFDPERPLTVNGYLFEPAQRASAAVEDDEMGGGFDG